MPFLTELSARYYLYAVFYFLYINILNLYRFAFIAVGSTHHGYSNYMMCISNGPGDFF